ncbi:MAG: hypothetical protein CMC96_13935 [Flavobacteriales bacterium]|nr:hypothetical protein [Flavobacteriales bacterium]|tara:strand:- start:2738 stop:2944 length:207 start_codon:yes stop_codon:yes gene_type:complete
MKEKGNGQLTIDNGQFLAMRWLFSVKASEVKPNLALARPFQGGLIFYFSYFQKPWKGDILKPGTLVPE